MKTLEVSCWTKPQGNFAKPVFAVQVSQQAAEAAYKVAVSQTNAVKVPTGQTSVGV